MLENLRQIGVFVRAAEHGSFAAAGEALGLTGSAVSKAVAALEASLGTPLFRRSSRGIELTPEGRGYHVRCKAILADLAEAGSDLVSARSRVTGRLRVCLHPSPGRSRIVPALPAFMRQHPQLELQVTLDYNPARFAERGFDLCVLLGDPSATWGAGGANGALTSIRLVDGQFLTCAAPEYLAARGVPTVPEDLTQHDTLVSVSADGRHLDEWHFADDQRHCVVRVQPLLAINDGPALVNVAIAGQGVVQLPSLNLEGRIARGELVRLLPQWYSEAPPVSLVFPASARRLPKVRVFVEFLQTLFRDVGPGTARPPAAHRARQWPVRLGVQRRAA
jgi:LysR family transcriptional regulator for bpeEF and oprC